MYFTILLYIHIYIVYRPIVIQILLIFTCIFVPEKLFLEKLLSANEPVFKNENLKFSNHSMCQKYFRQNVGHFEAVMTDPSFPKESEIINTETFNSYKVSVLTLKYSKIGQELSRLSRWLAPHWQ
jgi:hypothetical protein